MSDIDLQFPIGRFQRPTAALDAVTRGHLIDDVERLPHDIRAAVENLSDGQLDMPYRPGGWTARQVIHHVPESHMNAFIRFKLALTEESPTIRPYMEAEWAKLPDSRQAPADMSLSLLDALHRRWTLVLRNMTAADFNREYVHPEMGAVRLDAALAMYSWHGKHHTAHIRSIVG